MVVEGCWKGAMVEPVAGDFIPKQAIPVFGVTSWVGKFFSPGFLAGITQVNYLVNNGISITQIPSGSLVKCVYFSYQQPSTAKNMGFACCQDFVVAPNNS